MAEQSASSVASSIDVPRFRDAFERLREEIAAVAQDQLMPINVEIPSAVTTVLGALSEIRALRPRIIEELPKFSIERFDKLEAYTLAVGHAHTLHMASALPVEALPVLAEQCASLRETLLMDAKTLAHRGLIDGSRLRELKGTTGYRHIAFDLFLMAQILRENWSKIEGKSALSLAELNHAESLADRLATAVGVREQSAAGSSDTAALRERAFTLFIKTYNDVRRAAQYLSPGEAEEIAPTVYIGGRAAAKRKPEVEASEVKAPEPPVPAPANGQVPARVPPAGPNDSPYTV